MMRLDRGILARRMFGFLAVAGLAGALPAAADDAAVRQRIEARLEKAGLDTTADVQVHVRDGGAVLSGAVTTVHDRRRAAKAASKETRTLDNQIRVFPEERSDTQLVEAVRRVILQYPYYGVFDSIEMGVQGGVVILRGSVRADNRRNDIDDEISRLAGVKDIVNEIQVQSASIYDDRLRAELYRAIYGSERFVQWAHRSDPPVRIVVDRGRVTLTGYVPSRVDRAVLEHIARGTLAFAVENRVKVDGEDQKEPAKRSNQT